MKPSFQWSSVVLTTLAFVLCSCGQRENAEVSENAGNTIKTSAVRSTSAPKNQTQIKERMTAKIQAAASKRGVPEGCIQDPECIEAYANRLWIALATQYFPKHKTVVLAAGIGSNANGYQGSGTFGIRLDNTSSGYVITSKQKSVVSRIPADGVALGGLVDSAYGNGQPTYTGVGVFLIDLNTAQFGIAAADYRGYTICYLENAVPVCYQSGW